nr:diguanylate cyclase [uncultured Bosea sp.]
MVILTDVPQAGASHVAERMVQGVRDLNIAHGTDRVTISVGVATAWPDSEGDPARLVNAADLALFRAKNEGRNRLVFAELPPNR